MKRIDTQSTLVSAKHGLVANGRYTNFFDLKRSAQYSYELQVTAKFASGACAGTCQMATPTVLRFQQGSQVPFSISLTGGFGRYEDTVLPSTPTSKGHQKIEVAATVPHQLGGVPWTDALDVNVG
jgi:hypothetical protein